MILIARRPASPGGGWGYLGEEAGDEYELPAPGRSGEAGAAAAPGRFAAGSRAPARGASAADTIPVLPAITDSGPFPAV